MRDWKYILKLTGILLAITAIVAALLGFINLLTEERIAANTAEKARAAMETVLPAGGYTPLELTEAQKQTGVTEAYLAGDAGYVVRLSRNGFGGAIDLMVGVKADGTVSGVSIISHAETASLGANCTREDFRSQFTGKSGPLAVSKDGGEIDALTGATVTSRAVTEAVNIALDFVKEVQE